MKYYAGLDVSADTTSICVVDQTGAKQFETQVASSPREIVTALKPYRPLLVKAAHETGPFSP